MDGELALKLIFLTLTTCFVGLAVSAQVMSHVMASETAKLKGVSYKKPMASMIAGNLAGVIIALMVLYPYYQGVVANSMASFALMVALVSAAFLFTSGVIQLAVFKTMNMVIENRQLKAEIEAELDKEEALLSLQPTNVEV